MKLKSLYKFNLGHAIQNNCIALGKFDGEKFSISYATQGGNLIIYSPYDKQINSSAVPPVQRKGNNNQEFKLSLNKEVTCICYGKGDSNSNKQYLFIGSPSSLMCYDVIDNKTMFNKDINDGVFCIISGIFSTFSNPLAIVGGNCSLQGFDINGEEQFWTVTGGDTLCLALNDVDDDSFTEIIAGSDDYVIRYYKKEQNINDIPESNKVIILQSVTNNKFIYALENGTIGMYHREKKVWIKKEIGKPVSIVVCDINRDNREEVIVGWSNGKVLILSDDTGETLEELDFNNIGISKLFWENLSGAMNNSNSAESASDNNQLIICLNNGEVWGYDFNEQESFTKVEGYNEENTKLQRLLNEKKVLISQIEKLSIEITNKKKVNMNKIENSLTDDVKVTIDLQSNNEDVRIKSLTL